MGVIDEVLDLVRVQSGDLNLVDGRFELSELVGRSCETVATLARARKVELSTALPHDGPTILVDHGRIWQVIIALLSNCIALIGNGGRVHIQVSKTAPGGAMVLIRATGSTVSPEKWPWRWNPLTAFPPARAQSDWVSAMDCPLPAVWWSFTAEHWM